MAYSNSPLVTTTILSPNYNKRTKPITKITIHHMAAVMNATQCGNIFKSRAKQGSSNYGIGNDGSVGLYVEEKNRAWTSGNATNDQMAVTIEVSNSKRGGDWPVGAKAYNKLIDLCVDICKRNGINQLVWTGDKNGTLTCHYMFQATACPGPYLKARMANIASEVNKRLAGSSATAPDSVIVNPTSYKYNNIDYGLVFDPKYYADSYADLKKVFGYDAKKLFSHFCNFGMKEHRKAKSTFDPVKYRQNYADLNKAFGDNWPIYYEHYIKCGYKEGRKAI